MARKKYLLEQDDCAPDSIVYFEEVLKKKFHLCVQAFIQFGEFTVSEDQLHLEWRLGDYVLSYDGDDPFYKLERRED